MLSLKRITEITSVRETTWLDDRSQPQPCLTWGSPICACSLTALPDKHLAPRLAGHRAQPEELMLGQPPRPDTVVVGARAVRLCEARTNVPQPRTQPLQRQQEVPWDRAGTSCCSPTLAPPAQLPQPPYLKAHCGFLFLTVLQLLLNLLKLLPSVSALTPACCHPRHSSPRSWLSSAQAPASLVPTAPPLPSELSLSSSQNFPVKCPAEVWTGQQHFPHPT